MIRGIRDFLMLGVASSALAVFAGAVPPAVLGVHPALAASVHANDNAGDHGNNGNGGGEDAIGLANADPRASDNPGGGPPTSLPALRKPQGAGDIPGASPNSLPASAKLPATGVVAVSVDAQAGALHAGNANLQAFLHANPRSEVGLIAIYAQALVQVERDVAAVAAAAATFDGSLTAFKTAYPAYPDYSLETLTARYDFLSGLGSPTTEEQAELAALSTALSSQAALDLVAAGETLLADQMLAADALQTAANKPVTGAVEAWLDAQLEQGGILAYYRTQ